MCLTSIQGVLVLRCPHTYCTHIGLLTTAKVYYERSLEVFVIHKCSVLARTAGMLQGKITILVPPEYVTTLLIQ